jgi:hypothetical protein
MWTVRCLKGSFDRFRGKARLYMIPRSPLLTGVAVTGEDISVSGASLLNSPDRNDELPVLWPAAQQSHVQAAANSSVPRCRRMGRKIIVVGQAIPKQAAVWGDLAKGKVLNVPRYLGPI